MSHAPSMPLALHATAARSWWCWEWEAAVLALFVVGVYFTRLTAIPVCGEESRWAEGAREMIASGDWVVPRQQGMIFAERPPATIWAIALAGMARGQVDLVAVRLPSALAMLLLTWLIYAYARVWMSRLAALAAALAFASCGQVLQIGRQGESESLFTLLIAGSLFIWHAGYLRSWSPWLVWPSAYALAALGALSKGPQAPVYFAISCWVYLALKRDWRWLLGRAHLAGLICFALVFGAWLLPFALLQPSSVDDILAGLAQDRFTTVRLLDHVASYPMETFGCLLPWSPVLLMLFKPHVARSLWQNRPPVQFLLVALAVTYPTVWFAAAARGRYYMPMYPALAVLTGLVIEHCVGATASRFERVSWRRYLRCVAAIALCGGAFVLWVTLWPGARWPEVAQPLGFACACGLAAAVAASTLAWASFGEQSPRPQIALVAVAGFFGLATAGAFVNARVTTGNDLQGAVAALKQQLPSGAVLTSLGRVYHRFAYSYESPIRRIDWPTSIGELPDDFDYFCFDLRRTDTEESRASGDGRDAVATPGRLPFEWERIAELPCDPTRRHQADVTVIVGRVRRPASVAEPPTSRPALR